MRRTALAVAVGGSYAMVAGILLLLVVALTTAVADGWRLQAAAALRVERSPAFSPDGSRIAFIRAGEGAPRLWVMDADGANELPLARATRFSWAPRGDALLFSRGGERVFRVSASGGPAVAVRARLGRRETRSQRRSVFVRGGHLWLRGPGGAAWELT